MSEQLDRPSPLNAAIPSARDEKNARMRQEIAERFEAEYLQCLAWAETAFGLGWEPSGRHYILDKAEEDRYRMTGERPTPEATVYTVKNAKGEQRHFSIVDGQAVEHASYKDGFGAMLDEPHPTMTIEVRGAHVHPHRYSLCWASIETYSPKTAEQLATLRVSRERKKVEREVKKWTEEHPIFALAGLTWEEMEK